MAPVRIEPATPKPQIKHSTTESLCSLKQSTVWIVGTESTSDLQSIQWCNFMINQDKKLWIVISWLQQKPADQDPYFFKRGNKIL